MVLHLILSITNQNHPFYHSESLRWFPQHPQSASAFSRIATSGGLGFGGRISGRKNLDVLTEVNIVSPDFATLSRAPWREQFLLISLLVVVRICQSDISDSTREVEIREV